MASKLDFEQIIKQQNNSDLKSITTSSFVFGKVGYKIQRSAIDSVTDDYSYFDGTTLLATIRVVYATSAKEDVNSVERTA